jgi:hypothetical protein
MSNALRVIIAVAVVVTSLLVGVLVVDSLVTSTAAGNEQVTRQAVLGDTGAYTSLDNGVGQDETVWKTTGYAVNLTGADDSYVQSTDSVSISDTDTWTLSAWAYVDEGNAGANMTAVSLNGRLLLRYNGSANHWQAWYYDDGTRDSYVVNASTSGDEVGTFTHVLVRSNGTDLAIYRNATLGERKAITTGSSVAAPVKTDNWDGRLEEIRTFDEALNASERSALYAQPVEQRPGFDPTSRIMFDQPDKNTQLILYTSAALDQSNVTFSAGFAAQQMQEGDLAATGADYKWDPTGPQIAFIEGSELDGAPVAYASYTFGVAGVAGLVGGWATLIQVAALLPMIGIGLAILTKLREAQ